MIAKNIISVFISAVVIFSLSTPCQALEIFGRSSAAVEYGFDLMETFDDIQDWSGKDGLLGQAHDGISHSTYPKRLDGSNTPFNFYDYWVIGVDPVNDWIQDHRNHGGKIWDPTEKGVGKSYAIDFTGEYGTSRFGTYFGSADGAIGDKTHGYRDMYVFYMIYTPKEMWPRCIGVDDNSNCGGVAADCNGGSHCGYWNDADGDGYEYVLMKHQTVAHGFIEPWIHWEGSGSGHDPEYVGANSSYGWMPNVSHFIPRSGYPQLIWGDISSYLDNCNPQCHPASSEDVGDQVAGWPGVEVPVDQWVGLEVRYKLNDRGMNNGIKDMWYYDTDGTEHHIGAKNDLFLQSTYHYDADDKYNAFYLGGNVSDTYKWGPGMKSEFYVDDLVINGSRIGPTYFSLLNSQSISETCSDNIQNQDETGIDCGGVCEACVIPTIYTLTNFISAITNWLQIGNTESDVNSDRIVNTRDLGVIMSNWGN
ncbi:MAG: hypothetical protein UR69_C0001G0295 [Candidatus Moranbacteria bacterium GW2011_GWE2_35_2-]|nr:MAG: hypothetical protein UR69_C0001G0295 [Candidatus Moranbacteria bacterium GW2011_GWE2_35_2-]KKQ21824.1 MAG: hypothetical protein US37_C0007G0022 [Candidatus Moranbacteria bacterium GW2011_GWF2_37_11]KKQ28861.1 MAG: hypothetical protein US44_C0005G0003 [Candidatus Moranbacteria bacterium GW2011_GWD1_37_17]KKQ31062.1 MAG: hypothetical protein US47_C0001G0295 [Candidatus Moranbacteria bacterium GW2011_GWE1_37_24]HBO16740.1 hypothetical protein [Candidatus Moranbacteria bacterium]